MLFDIFESLSRNKYQKEKLDGKNSIKKDRFITFILDSIEYSHLISIHQSTVLKVSKACMHREMKDRNRWILFFHEFNFLL